MAKEHTNIGLKCCEDDCTNKFFRMDRISPIKELPMCRKHWYMHNYGLSEWEASRR